MTDHKRDSHQHHRSGDAAQNETDKSQTRTIGHVDALKSFCRYMTQDRAKGSFQAVLFVLRNHAKGTLNAGRDASRSAVTRWGPKGRYNMA